jgi:hypothetical protein
VNPEQIDIVVRTWHEASRDERRLVAALLARLPGDDPGRAVRARWIVDAVTVLAPMIHRPTRFAAGAAELVGRRGAVTMGELGTDQAALLGALDELVERFDDRTARAWSLALKLFEETIADGCLDPFAVLHDPGVAS